MICIQKIYGFDGLNHQIIEESWDVTPVTNGGQTEDGWRTDGGKWKIGQCSRRPETTITMQDMESEMCWCAGPLHEKKPRPNNSVQHILPVSKVKFRLSIPLINQLINKCWFRKGGSQSSCLRWQFCSTCPGWSGSQWRVASWPSFALDVMVRGFNVIQWIMN